MLMEFGVSPQAFDDLSLAEITSTLTAMKRRQDKNRPGGASMTGKEFDDLKAAVAEMNMPDVRLH